MNATKYLFDCVRCVVLGRLAVTIGNYDDNSCKYPLIP